MDTTPAPIPALQTAQVAWINNQWAEHPANDLTPARLGLLLRDAEQGDILAQSDLFSDVEERDLHIQSELAKRRRAVTLLPWALVPRANATDAEKKISETLTELIESIEELPELLFDLTDAIAKGFSAVEIEWARRRDGLWVPKRFHFRDQRLFKIARMAGSEEVRLNDMSAQGQRLQQLGWILHRSKARSGSMVRAPLFRTLVWAFLPKAFALNDWSEFLEVYGYPMRLGKYSPAATSDERSTLLRAVVDLGRRAGGIIPESMNISLLDAVTGDPEAFHAMVSYQDKLISTAILGGTLTTQADGKSSTNALGNVHNEVRMDLRDDDAQNLAATLTRDLVLALGTVNGLVDDPLRCPRWQFDTQEAEDLTAYADALPKLVGVGMQIDADWAHERLKIPKASTPANALKTPTSPVSFNPGNVGAIPEKAASNFAGAIAAAISPDAIDVPHETVLNQIEMETESALGDWLNTLKAKVERAESMEALRNDLINSYGHLPVERIAAVMEAGFALRALQGMEDVLAESTPQATEKTTRPAGGGAGS